jgi:hypothetical protein
MPRTLVEPPTERLSCADVGRMLQKSPCVVNRWMARGVRGQRLASFFEGGRRYTTPDLLQDFRARLNADATADVAPQSKPARRPKGSRAAGELLKNSGC